MIVTYMTNDIIIYCITEYMCNDIVILTSHHSTYDLNIYFIINIIFILNYLF